MRRKTVLLLAVLLIFSFVTVEAGNIKELQDQKSKIQKQIKSKKSEMKAIKKECSQVASEIQRLDQEMDSANTQIASLESEINKLEKEIENNQNLLNETSLKLDRNMTLFGERLNAMQKVPEFSTLELLLNSKNLDDYLRRKKLILNIAEQDSKLISDIKEDKEKIEETKFLLSKQRDYTLQKKDDLLRQREKLLLATREKQDLMRSLNSDKAKIEQSINAFNASANELTKKIQSLQKSATSKYVGGRLAWPTPGHERITSPYGNRIHPILKKKMFHSGVDIGAPSGTAIKAAGNGTVIHADWYQSYGKMVMVDHGGGIVTLYAHCSSILVSKGQEVTAGQTLAKVGSTGRSTGPHLHFEVRKDGKFQNPLDWVK